ncbi:MAG: PEP-CTERM sorting domain-containing protein [Chthonomonas sp.]|nr:PEP-CTERM sorting domain-containing protein [Chthonomonas sp.]
MNRFFVTVGLAVAGVSAHAAIVNASFENPAQLSGSFTQITPPGWVSDGIAGVWRYNTGSLHFAVTPPDGSQVGYLNARVLAQTTTTVLEQGITTLLWFSGRRFDSLEGVSQVELWAGGSLSSTGAMTGGSLLNSRVIAVADVTKGAWKEFSFNYTAGANDPNLGKNLTIRFVKTSGGQIDFDHVRLNTVPEPATFLAIGLGVVALAARRRR